MKFDGRKNYTKTKGELIIKDWTFVTLGQLFDNRRARGEKGTPIFSVTLSSGLVSRETLNRRVGVNVSPENSLLVEPGDIAYNMMRMWQGALDVCRERCVVSPAYVVCRPHASKVFPLFMYYFFKSPIGLYKLWAYSYGVANDRLRLYYNDFQLIPLFLPPLPEQKAIASALECWDKTIRKFEEKIEKKKNIKKGLMQKLLSGEQRLPGFDGDWNTEKAERVFTERKERGNGCLPLISITRNDGVIPRDEVDRKDTSSKDKSNYRKICAGDIGYNSMRMWQGVSGLSQHEGIVSPAYTICIPCSDLYPLYIAYLFKMPFMIKKFYRYSQGITSDTWNLKFPLFKHIDVEFPPLPEQKAIASVLSSADSEIRVLKKKLAFLRDQKKYLLNNLVTGTIRLPEFCKVVG